LGGFGTQSVGFPGSLFGSSTVKAAKARMGTPIAALVDRPGIPFGLSERSLVTGPSEGLKNLFGN
jgi:hypothetical protein